MLSRGLGCALPGLALCQRWRKAAVQGAGGAHRDASDAALPLAVAPPADAVKVALAAVRVARRLEERDVLAPRQHRARRHLLRRLVVPPIELHARWARQRAAPCALLVRAAVAPASRGNGGEGNQLSSSCGRRERSGQCFHSPFHQREAPRCRVWRTCMQGCMRDVPVAALDTRRNTRLCVHACVTGGIACHQAQAGGARRTVRWASAPSIEVQRGAVVRMRTSMHFAHPDACRMALSLTDMPCACTPAWIPA